MELLLGVSGAACHPLQRQGPHGAGAQAEQVREEGPQVAPAEAVAVDHVEGAVGATRLGEHPQHALGDQGRVRDLEQRGPRAGLAGEVEGQAQLPAYRGVAAERRDHVAGAPTGHVEDEARQARGPRPISAPPAFGHQVLLVVVEVGRHVPRVALARRRAVGPDVHAVPLGAVHEVEVGEARQGGLRHVQQVAQHGKVRRHVLHPDSACGAREA